MRRMLPEQEENLEIFEDLLRKPSVSKIIIGLALIILSPVLGEALVYIYPGFVVSTDIGVAAFLLGCILAVALFGLAIVLIEISEKQSKREIKIAERWDILDDNGHKTGRVVNRGEVMEKDEYHLLVHVWIRNSKGDYLISKRSPNKKYPNMWETTVGAVVSGEESIVAALREVKEELGITLSPSNGKYLFRIKRDNLEHMDFIDVWLFNHEIDIRDVTCQPEEVCGAKWATEGEIKAAIEMGEFMDTFTYIDKLFSDGGKV
jgi:Isopentenyldiphosphate isomerase